MDLSNISELSDAQLVALYRNPTTVDEIKKAIIKEINLRESNLDYKDDKDSDDLFSDTQKLLLLFTPFLMQRYRKVFFKKGWSRKKEKAFWSFINMGFAIYLIIFLIGLLSKTS